MRKLFNFSLLIFVFILLFSCNNGLVPMITENPTDTKTNEQLTPPADFKATGGKRKITLEWTESANATNYEIYAARTQFDEFVKVGDSSSSTFEYKVSPGITRYFKIVAQNDVSGKSSEPSQIIKGYSLATPVISEIIPTVSDETNNKTTVYWFMKNVEDYQDLVCYEVICYDGALQIAEQQISGAETTQTFYTFKNLPQNKNLQFEVQAYFQSEQGEIESSGKMDTRTAAMQTPKAVESFTATEGTSKDTIELSFKLPETAYIKVGTANGENVYDQYPLYFAVYKRVAGEKNWSPWIDHLYFDGTTTGGSGDEYFEKYVAGAVVSFKDEGLSNETKFEYKVQSYIDNYFDKNNNPILISSERISVATSTGWTCGIPYLKTDDFNYECEYDAGEPIKKLSATLDFKASWNNFGNEGKYNFILETTRKDNLADTTGTTTDKSFATLKQINDYCKSFNLTNETGYYSFKLYVVPAGKDKSQAIADCDAAGTILVTEVFKTPEFNGFEVISGYAEKVVIKWGEEGVDSYSLIRCTFENNKKVDGSEIPFDDVSSELIPTGGFYTFEDTKVESGKQYEYTLIAEIGSMQYTSIAKTAETLGTPVPKFDADNPEHTSIKLTWDKVLQADEYEITLKDENKNPIATITQTAYGETETCIIENPTGYDDATKSGQTWTATVTAKNNTTGVSTNAEKEVRTLGPALTSPTTTPAASADSITVTWNVVPGAKGYAVKRTRYDVKNAEAKATDVYYVSANPTGSTSDVKKDGTALLTSVATATMSGDKIIFTDKYKEKPKLDPTKWDDNQDKLAWGFPYHYTVLPLKSIDEDFDETTGALGSVTYKNIDDSRITKVGSCRGYGHNVKATKSEYTKQIKITWDNPYGINDDMTKNANLYISKSGKNEWSCTNIKATLNDAKTDYEFIVNLKGKNDSEEQMSSKIYSRTGAYDFLVTYNQSDVTPNESYYLNHTQETVINDADGESINKGYAFAIDELTTEGAYKDTGSHKSGFDEYIEWNAWDFSKRKKGPEEFTISIFNNDYNGSWNPIAKVDKNGNIELIGGETNTTLNISMEKYNDPSNNLNGRIILRPHEQSKDSDNVEYGYYGLLKVLRDWKHYVRIEATHKYKDSNEVEHTVNLSYTVKENETDNEDFKKYVYREITDAEFCRAVSLIVADAIYQAGIKDGGFKDCIGAEKDKYFHIRHNSNTKTVTWGTIGNYKHIFRGGVPGLPNSDFTSSFIISVNDHEHRRSANGTTLYYLETGSSSITVTHSSGLSSYKGSLSFTVGEMGSKGSFMGFDSENLDEVKLSWVLSINKDGMSVKDMSTQNETEFKKWFPYDIGTSHESGITKKSDSALVYDSTYGWW